MERHISRERNQFASGKALSSTIVIVTVSFQEVACQKCKSAVKALTSNVERMVSQDVTVIPYNKT